MRISIVICAAGAGTRMGCPKALCRLPSERTFLEHIVQTAQRASISSIVVVTGAQAEDVRQVHRHLDVTWCENKDWQSTYMLESLVCGLHHVPAHHMVLHWPVDCIGITAEDLCYLIQSPISPFAVPTNNGQPGHPLRISSPKVEILKSQHPFSSLKEFVASDICTKIEVKSDVLLNCNDREALQNFMLRMGGL
jgi:molybdenum cofactor cytidylyltransferase